MTTTAAHEPSEGSVMFTDENGTLWHYRRSVREGDARRVFVYLHDFRAHMTTRYLHEEYGQTIETLAQMHDAMCWAEHGVLVHGLR